MELVKGEAVLRSPEDEALGADGVFECGVGFAVDRLAGDGLDALAGGYTRAGIEPGRAGETFAVLVGDDIGVAAAGRRCRRESSVRLKRWLSAFCSGASGWPCCTSA
jgi:hypothetical protein